MNGLIYSFNYLHCKIRGERHTHGELYLHICGMHLLLCVTVSNDWLCQTKSMFKYVSAF